jgi:tRNA pseudouridine38-40 synthase
MIGEVPKPEVMRPSLWLWATVEYDGTGFCGFQIQPHGRTVQGELERALARVSGRATRVIGAGRTDRGVHARGQVISCRIEWRHSLSDLQRALNAVLAADVAVLAIGRAPEDFHPRFSATCRAYRYTLLSCPWRSPLERRTAWHLAQGLDVAEMGKASQRLLGTHDFSAFGRPPQGENTARTVVRAEWHELEPFVVFDIEANAFLYRMVRSIVGTLVQVGLGQMSSEEFETILQSRDRSRVKKVAPPHGLCLMEVEYAKHEGVLW